MGQYHRGNVLPHVVMTETGVEGVIDERGNVLPHVMMTRLVWRQASLPPRHNAELDQQQSTWRVFPPSSPHSGGNSCSKLYRTHPFPPTPARPCWTPEPIHSCSR